MITINLTMAATVAVLYSVGFYLLLSRSLMRVLIGVVVLGHASNLLLQLAGGPPGRAPILGGASAERLADPLPQALALTAVVITFALTTFLLALGYRAFALVGHDEVQDDVEDRRIARTRTASGDLEPDDPDPAGAGATGAGSAERADDKVESAAGRGGGGRGGAGRGGAG